MQKRTEKHACAEFMRNIQPEHVGNTKPCSCGRVFEHRDLTWWRAMFMLWGRSVPAQFAGVWTCVGHQLREVEDSGRD